MGDLFRGLTWDHPRGYNALAAAARLAAPDGAVSLAWDRQPLEGFESAPIGELAERYDLLVLDHPHIGEAVALDCLTPVDELFAAGELAGWETQTIGAAMASYRWQGRQWGLPLDVATQVTATRADLLGAPPPDTWEEVLRLSERRPVAVSVAGPHALCSTFSVALSLGDTPGGELLFDDAAFAEAVDILRRLAAGAPAGTEALNPIALLGAMAAGDAIACVPLVYGYVNYSFPLPGRAKVTFAEAPAGEPGGRRGSVLGGTGIAVSKRARPDAALLSHLRWLMSVPVQSGFIPDHDGQPSARAAWTDAEVDRRAQGFYSGTLATTEGAWVRPRHDGYIAFQTEGSAILREAILGGAGIADTLARLRAAWQANRARARGPLT